MYYICSKLTIMTTERHYWHYSGDARVNLEGTAVTLIGVFYIHNLVDYWERFHLVSMFLYKD